MRTAARTVLSGGRDDVVHGVDDEVDGRLGEPRELGEVERLLGARGPVARHGVRAIVRVHRLGEVEPQVADTMQHRMQCDQPCVANTRAGSAEDVRGLSERDAEELVRRAVDGAREGALVEGDRRGRALVELGGRGEGGRGEDEEAGERAKGDHLESVKEAREGRARGREGPGGLGCSPRRILTVHRPSARGAAKASGYSVVGATEGGGQ